MLTLSAHPAPARLPTCPSRAARPVGHAHVRVAHHLRHHLHRYPGAWVGVGGSQPECSPAAWARLQAASLPAPRPRHPASPPAHPITTSQPSPSPHPQTGNKNNTWDTVSNGKMSWISIVVATGLAAIAGFIFIPLTRSHILELEAQR